jgi:uncharacterized membrane protein
MKKFINLVLDGYLKLLFPLLVCIILLGKLLQILNPVVHFLKDKLHITKLVGFLDVFLISLVLLLLIGLLAGLLIKSNFIQQKTKWLEDTLLRKLPFYNELKSMLHRDSNDADENNYRPALVKEGDSFSLGYVTGKSKGFYTVIICDTNLQGGELRIVPKELVKLLDISFFEFSRRIRQYGANIADFAEE